MSIVVFCLPASILLRQDCPNKIGNLSFLISIFRTQPVNEEADERWYYFVLDRMIIVQFVFVYLAYHFF